MKKFLLSLFALVAIAANAQTYTFTDNFTTSMGSLSSDPAQATITITKQSDGKYTFYLPNFVVSLSGWELPVGNIEVTDIEGDELLNGKTILAMDEKVKITAGDDPNFGADEWVGPWLDLLGGVGMKMEAVMTELDFHAKMDFDVSSILGDIIYAEFGSDITDTFDGNLKVSALGITLYEDVSSIFVTTQTDGKFGMTLKNFSMTMTGVKMNLGTIVVNDIEGTPGDGCVNLSTSQYITIQPGDDIDGITWSGPDLGEISVTVAGELTAGTLTATITIPVGMNVTVNFNGTTAGIKSVTSSSSSRPYDNTPYTLQGIKASEGYKGIVIKNGKKVLKK